MIYIQATTKSKYYDHIVLLYLESIINQLFLFVFTYMFLWLTSSIINIPDVDQTFSIGVP